MGRNTYFSLPEKFRPLPNRRNIVVTRQLIEGVECYSSIDELIDTMSKEKAEILFLIGWASLYDQFFEKWLIDRVELTLVTWTHKGKDSDIFVKEFRHNFHEIKSEDFNSGKFITLEKN